MIPEGGGDSSRKKNSARSTREQDQYMPIANVIRIMRRVLPTNSKIADDAKETMQDCVSEYISFITSEANERCQQEQRKTITAEDVLWAMQRLGFDDYLEPLIAFLDRYRQQDPERNPVRSEPLMNRNVDYAQDPMPIRPPTYLPAIPVAHHRGVFGPVAINGLYSNTGAGQVGSSTLNAAYPPPTFDPYAQFK